MRKLSWISTDADNKKNDSIPNDPTHVRIYGLEGDDFILTISSEDGRININGTDLNVSYITAARDDFALTPWSDILWQKPEWMEVDDGGIPAYKIGYRIRGYRIDAGSWETGVYVIVPKEKRHPLRVLVSGTIEMGCTGMIDIKFGRMKKRIPAALRPGVPRERWVRLVE